MDSLIKAIKHFGGQTRLAEKLGVKQPVVGNWLLRQSVPPAHALRIEELTRKKVKARDLCPRVFGANKREAA